MTGQDRTGAAQTVGKGAGGVVEGESGGVRATERKLRVCFASSSLYSSEDAINLFLREDEAVMSEGEVIPEFISLN